MGRLQELKKAVALLDFAYEAVKRSIIAEVKRYHPDIDDSQLEVWALREMDESGRYILLDALTALVNAQATLARVEE